MLGRWAQPDSLVPLASQGVQAWDRYAFVNNNALRYNDPSGHDVGNPGEDDHERRCKEEGCMNTRLQNEEMRKKKLLDDLLQKAD
jgi:hypothetical protein